MIRRTGNQIRHSLTVQVCLWVVGFVAVLLVVFLYTMFHHAHETINREAMEKARQTLCTTELRIDNTLSDVETATRSMHWFVEHHLDQPELMDSVCRQVVAMNPQVQGCAVAFEPGLYPQYGTYHEVYAYRSKNSNEINVALNSGKQPYTHQKWYFEPLHHGEQQKPDGAAALYHHAAVEPEDPRGFRPLHRVHQHRGRLDQDAGIEVHVADVEHGGALPDEEIIREPPVQVDTVVRQQPVHVRVIRRSKM